MAERFVGRRAELALLTDLVAGVARRRRAATAVVTGEPGSGKSRLLAEVAARSPGPRVLRVTGFEPEKGLPFAAARDLLRTLAAVPGDGPIIATVLGGADPRAPRRLRQTDDVRLFEAAHRSLARLLPGQLIVDDLQWVDRSSVALCHYLFRAAHVAGSPLAFIVSGRPSREALAFSASLARIDGVHPVDVELGPLDRAAGIQFVATLRPDLPEPDAEEIWRRADGSPFWMARLLGRGRTGDTGALVAALMRSTGADGVALMTCLVAAGRPIDGNDAAEVLGWPEERVVMAADELEALGLVADVAGSLRVAHDLIREGSLRVLSRRRLVRMHGLLAAWLEATASDDAVGLQEALGHRELAGLPSVELALRLALAPNRHLLEPGALGRLGAIADGCAAPDPSCRELRRAVADLADLLGAHEEAYVRWTELARSERTPDAGLAWLAASRSAVELARRDDAWRTLVLARRSGPRSAAFRVEVLTQRAAILRALDRSATEARATAERAVDLARAMASAAGGRDRMDDTERRAAIAALMAASDAALMVDDPGAVLAHADELLAVGEGVDDRLRLQALAEGGLALRLMGRNRDAEQRLARAWDEAGRLVLPQAMLEVGAILAAVLHSLGRFDEARSILRVCAELRGRHGRFRPAQAFGIVTPHLVELSAGDWRTAVDALSAAAATEEDPHYRLHPRVARSAALARLDPRRAAGEVATEVRLALADAIASGCERCRGEVLTRGAEALARVGRVASAGRLDRVFDRTARHGTDAAMPFWRLRAAAQLAVASSSPDATRLLEATIAEADAQDLVLESLWARLDLGLHLAGAERDAAADVLRRAGADAERLGARTEQRVAEQGLRSLGVRTWRRSRSGGRVGGLEALTEREREVAELAAGGASNPEIAAALFLSRKTVERHLSNALARLGVRNRAELAALVGGAASAEPDRRRIEGPPR